MEYKQLMELKEKTTVFENVPSIVHRASWLRCSRIEVCSYQPSDDDHGFFFDLVENQEGLTADYSNGLEYYAFDLVDGEVGSMTTDRLPIELFNHQLFDSGKKTEDRTRTFMEGYGLLFSPLRSDWACFDGWQLLETMSMQGVKETDILIERKPELKGLAVSKLEASATHAVLEEMVLFLRKYIRSGGKDDKSLSMLAQPLTAASCNPYQVDAPSVMEPAEMAAKIAFAEAMDLLEPDRTRALEALSSDQTAEFPRPLRQMGMLTSAICNQILSTIANEDVPWRKCALDDCDVIFKYPQSNAVKLMQDAAYCCPKHGDRARKRKSRAKQVE